MGGQDRASRRPANFAQRKSLVTVVTKPDYERDLNLSELALVDIAPARRAFSPMGAKPPRFQDGRLTGIVRLFSQQTGTSATRFSCWTWPEAMRSR